MESKTVRGIGVVLLLLGLLLSQGGMVFAQQAELQISDVPADHWAMRSQKLVRKDILASIPMEPFKVKGLLIGIRWLQ